MNYVFINIVTKQVSIYNEAYNLVLKESTKRKLDNTNRYLSKHKTLAYIISSIIEKELGELEELEEQHGVEQND